MQTPQVSCHQPLKLLCFKLSGCVFELQQIALATACTVAKLQKLQLATATSPASTVAPSSRVWVLLTLAAELGCRTCILAED